MEQCPENCTAHASNPVSKSGRSDKIRKIVGFVNDYSILLGSSDHEIITSKNLRPDDIKPDLVHRVILVILAYYFEDVFDAKSYWCTYLKKLKKVEMSFKMSSKMGPDTYDGSMQAFYLAILPFFSNAGDLEFGFAVIAMPHCAHKQTINAIIHLYESGVAYRQQCRVLKEQESEVVRAAIALEEKMVFVKSLRNEVKFCEEEEINMLEDIEMFHHRIDAMQQKKQELLVKFKYEMAVGDQLDSKIETVKAKIQNGAAEAATEVVSVTPMTFAQEVNLEKEAEEALKEQQICKIHQEKIADVKHKLRNIVQENDAAELAVQRLGMVKQTAANTINKLLEAGPILRGGVAHVSCSCTNYTMDESL